MKWGATTGKSAWAGDGTIVAWNTMATGQDNVSAVGTTGLVTCDNRVTTDNAARAKEETDTRRDDVPAGGATRMTAHNDKVAIYEAVTRRLLPGPGHYIFNMVVCAHSYGF